MSGDTAPAGNKFSAGILMFLTYRELRAKQWSFCAKLVNFAHNQPPWRRPGVFIVDFGLRVHKAGPESRQASV